jgi:hypothetical protein
LGNGKWKSQAHIAALYPRNSNQVTVISIDHLPRFTPLFMALMEGVSERGFTGYAFFIRQLYGSRLI